MDRRGAFTLLELAIYVTLLVLLGSPFVTLVLTSSRTTAEHDTVHRVEGHNRTALESVSRDIRRAIRTSVALSDGGLTLTFTPPAGFDGAAVIAGLPVRYAFRTRPGEAWNGADDDGNGVADDGQLVRVELATGVETVIADGFDLAASGFSWNGEEAGITATTLGSIDRRHGTFSVSRSVSVIPRN